MGKRSDMTLEFFDSAVWANRSESVSYSFSKLCKRWKLECPMIRGEGPEACEGHNKTFIGQRLFIFGGCGKSADNNNEVYYNDLYILNTDVILMPRES
ncbi:hypothetical protein P8452_37647 [Trifolium repens]|nr:hypothetical protein P8452_37647 [Trifolium repens]